MLTLHGWYHLAQVFLFCKVSLSLCTKGAGFCPSDCGFFLSLYERMKSILWLAEKEDNIHASWILRSHSLHSKSHTVRKRRGTSICQNNKHKFTGLYQSLKRQDSRLEYCTELRKFPVRYTADNIGSTHLESTINYN